MLGGAADRAGLARLQAGAQRLGAVARGQPGRLPGLFGRAQFGFGQHPSVGAGRQCFPGLAQGLRLLRLLRGQAGGARLEFLAPAPELRQPLQRLAPGLPGGLVTRQLLRVECRAGLGGGLQAGRCGRAGGYRIGLLAAGLGQCVRDLPGLPFPFGLFGQQVLLLFAQATGLGQQRFPARPALCQRTPALVLFEPGQQVLPFGGFALLACLGLLLARQRLCQLVGRLLVRLSRRHQARPGQGDAPVQRSGLLEQRLCGGLFAL